MNKELTFNDLPMVVAQLRDEVVGMKQMIIGLQSQNKPHKANTHIPMSVEEASAYLKMPMATLYMKLGNGSIPATKPGKRYCLYQDELDKWLETNRKNPVPLTAEEENAAHSCRKQAQAETLKLVMSWMRLNSATKSTWKPSL